eukprot:SAG31_NODE_687_length_12813_cov_2.597216_9_plen_122_part_00
MHTRARYIYLESVVRGTLWYEVQYAYDTPRIHARPRRARARDVRMAGGAYRTYRVQYELVAAGMRRSAVDCLPRRPTRRGARRGRRRPWGGAYCRYSTIAELVQLPDDGCVWTISAAVQHQ